jgi:hypothetical protein
VHHEQEQTWPGPAPLLAGSAKRLWGPRCQLNEGLSQPNVDRPYSGRWLAPEQRKTGLSRGSSFALRPMNPSPKILTPAGPEAPPTTVPNSHCARLRWLPHLDPLHPARTAASPTRPLLACLLKRPTSVPGDAMRCRCPFHGDGNARSSRFVYFGACPCVYYVSRWLDGW